VNISKVAFTAAKPIWVAGRQREMNLTVGFRVSFERPVLGPVTLRVAGSSFYRVHLNGHFILHGPARCAHGYYRVDVLELPEHLLCGVNTLAVEVAGYNVSGYYALDQSAFLQAEVVAGPEVLASTHGGGSTFQAYILKYRLQKVERYSMQRAFSEYYRLTNDIPWWDDRAGLEQADIAIQEHKELIARGLPLPHFNLRQPALSRACGMVTTGLPVENPYKGQTLTKIGTRVKSYRAEEFEVTQSIEMQGIRNLSMEAFLRAYEPRAPIEMGENGFRIFDFGTNLTGFPGATVECSKPVRLIMAFDECLADGDVNWMRLGCVNLVVWELEPGRYSLETFEPYTLKYLKIISLRGSCRITGLYLRELVNPESYEASFSCSDPRLNRVFDAAAETFRQNAVDIFMDCPSRERGGWLCDSFFTARAAFDISGHASLERNFLENYLLPDKYPTLVEGMLPPCYPSEDVSGRFIPNWAMWFVIELEEYLARSGDRAMVNDLKPKVMALLAYFARFENEYGLLEKLESWVFIEWSAANKFVQDVNYPTNMTYAMVLDIAGRLYNEPCFTAKAAKLRREIRQRSFDGELFVDNAVRENGILRNSTNRTEVCQYYAFFTGVATRDLYPDLWEKLVASFGPSREATGLFPEVHMANAFPGYFLRLELLGRAELCLQVRKELIEYFLKMAEKTGTLWEHDSDRASCNHGFASHVVHSLYRDVLGVRSVDPLAKTISISIHDVDLTWCKGTMLVPGGRLSIEWQRGGRVVTYKASGPAGYLLVVTAAGDNVDLVPSEGTMEYEPANTTFTRALQ